MLIGDISAKPIIEIPKVALPASFMFEVQPEALKAAIDRQESWTKAEWFDDSTHSCLLSTHSWLIDTGRHKIIIDPCVGNHKPRRVFPHFNMLDTPYLEQMQVAGAKPEDIDYVFCTHLHVDHCGWNTQLKDGRWVPTFPNAKYLFSQLEYDYWVQRSKSPKIESDASFGVLEDSVQPIIDAGLAHQLSSYDRISIENCLTIELGAGHTPGHLIASLVSGEHGAIFAGDALHHQIQICHPDWATKGSTSVSDSISTRQKILSLCADRGWFLMAAHFMTPHFVRVGRDSQGNFSILG